MARHGKDGNMHNVGLGGVPSAYMRVEYNRTVRNYLKSWDVNGDFVPKVIPENNWFFAQGRCLAPLPKGDVTLVGNVLVGATPPGQTISNQN